MAPPADRFSIRAYAAKMRNAVDLRKRWPFAGDGDDNQSLPSIDLRRYRWWADELSDLNDLRSTVDLIPESQNKGSDVADLNPTNGRHRAPKLRSIVEIFASSPQIVVRSDGGDGSERVEKQDQIALKERKRKRGGTKEGLKLKKEKVCEPKMIHMHQDTGHEKFLVKKAKAGAQSKKFAEAKTLPKKLPFRNILKNNKRFTSNRKSRNMNNAKKAIIIKRNRRTTKHEYRISGRNSKRLRMDRQQFKSLCNISSNVLPAFSDINNSSTSHELPPPAGIDDLINASDKFTNMVNGSSSDKIQLSGSDNGISHRTIEKSRKNNSFRTVKAPSVLILDLNNAAETHNNFECDNPSTKNFRGTTYKKRSSTSTIIPQGQLSKTSTLKPTEIKFGFNPCPHCSTSSVVVCNERNERQNLGYLDAGMNLSCHMLENQPRGHCCSEDFSMLKASGVLLNSISSCKSKSSEDDFIALPFNSQGELDRLRNDMRFVDQNVNENFSLNSNQVFSANKHLHVNANHLEIIPNIVFDAGLVQNDQSQWHLNWYHPAKVHHELNFAEITGSGKLNIRHNELVKVASGFLHSNPNNAMCSLQKNVVSDFYRKLDLQGKCNLDYQLEPVVQTTIRLMGKNIVVGGSNNGGDAISSCGCRTGNDVWHPYPTIDFYKKNIHQHMVSSSTNPIHTFLKSKPQFRYDDHKISELSLIQTPEKLPQCSRRSKYSEGNHLSSQSSSTSAVTVAYSGNQIDDQTFRKRPPDRDEYFMNSEAKRPLSSKYYQA